MLRKRRSQRMTVVEPLFPSYVFVRMSLDPDPWYAVKWTPGVKRIVGVGETPTPVPSEAMQLLLDRCGGGDIIQWRLRLQEGDPVRVICGPFAGLEGILDRPTSGGERVRVLLHLLGSTTAVEMDVTDIEHVA
jgi:transcription antitermination factor NusG